MCQEAKKVLTLYLANVLMSQIRVWLLAIKEETYDINNTCDISQKWFQFYDFLLFYDSVTRINGKIVFKKIGRRFFVYFILSQSSYFI